MILVYKFISVEPNRMLEIAAAEALENPDIDDETTAEFVAQAEAARPERPFVPKLVGDYPDLATARASIGDGEFAFYESVGKPDPETGLYKSFKPAGPVVGVTASEQKLTMREKKKVSIGK